MKFIWSLFLLFSFSVSAQKTLTKEQMYEDFDEMTQIILDCNPQLAVRKAVTGVDQTIYFKELRARIDTIKTYDAFITRVLNHVLVRMYDIHAVMAKEVYDFDIIEGIDVEAVGIQRKEMRKRREAMEMAFRPCEPINTPVYIQGDYYFLGKYIFINKEKADSLILWNPKLVSYGGTPYSVYAMKHAPHNVRWDHARKKYYALDSYFPGCKGKIRFEVNGKAIEFDKREYPQVNIDRDTKYHIGSFAHLPSYNYTQPDSRVSYFKEDKLLYIYMRKMVDDQGRLAEKIKKTAKGKEIGKIIIDIRDNQGGHDHAWHYLLQAIIADTLPDRATLAFKNSERIKALYRNSTTVENMDRWEVVSFPWLPSEEFIAAETSVRYFVPDTNSLRYKGRIYLLQNEYTHSSAQAFASYVRRLPQWITVGTPTGMPGGRGLAPALFQLKHSKFSFRLETALDVTDLHKLEDSFQDVPEMIIGIPFEEELKHKYCRYLYDQNSKPYLYEQDYVFRKVRDME